MTNALEVGQKYHQFQIAGLGAAPYRYLGCTKNIYTAGDGAHSQPGGTCDYCGNGIMWEFWLQGAGGKKFKVGSDCIMKADSDKALRVAVESELQKRQREQREARRQAKWLKDSERVKALSIRLPEVAEAFRSQPHPYAKDGAFFANKTLLDWAEWMLERAGMSGRLAVAKRIETELAKLVVK